MRLIIILFQFFFAFVIMDRTVSMQSIELSPEIKLDDTLTIKHETVGKCHFFKIELYNGQIVILDVCKKDIDANTYFNDNKSFSKRVILALKKINDNEIGKKLTKQLCEKLTKEDPLVIISYNIIGSAIGFIRNDYDNLDETNKIIKANELKTKIPDFVLKRLSTFPKSCKQSDWLDNFLFVTENGTIFSPKSNALEGYPCLPHNTIIVNFDLEDPNNEDNKKLTGFVNRFVLNGEKKDKIKGDTIALASDLNFDDDVSLFHELNHARHFLQNAETYRNGSDANNINNNNSSLYITINGIKSFNAIMCSAEEELQLTGFTILKTGEIIFDAVNETAYRLFCKNTKRIRFPYDLSISKDDNCNILYSDFKKLLQNALNKTIEDVFEVVDLLDSK